jgi:hypothetical protein
LIGSKHGFVRGRAGATDVESTDDDGDDDDGL